MSKITHNCIFLNSHGDLNIEWEENDHSKMKELILKKMKEGYLFFIIEKKFLGLYNKKTKLTNDNFNNQIKKQKLLIKDKDLDIFIKQASNAQISNSNNDSEYNVSKTLKEDDVVNNTNFNESTTLVASKPAIAG